MRITIVKWISIVALLAAAFFWERLSSYQLALDLLVSMAAALVALQALRAGESRWFAGFVAITLVFGACAAAALVNPSAPLLHIAGPLGILMVGLTLVSFGFSLLVLRAQSILSVPPMTGRNPAGAR